MRAGYVLDDGGDDDSEFCLCSDGYEDGISRGRVEERYYMAVVVLGLRVDWACRIAADDFACCVVVVRCSFLPVLHAFYVGARAACNWPLCLECRRR